MSGGRVWRMKALLKLSDAVPLVGFNKLPDSVLEGLCLLDLERERAYLRGLYHHNGYYMNG